MKQSLKQSLTRLESRLTVHSLMRSPRYYGHFVRRGTQTICIRENSINAVTPMWDFAFFLAVLFGIWAENWGGKRELQLRAIARFRVFMGLGYGFARGTSNRAGHSGLQFLLRPSAKTASWQKRSYYSYSYVRFQVINHNNYNFLKCDWRINCCILP